MYCRWIKIARRFNLQVCVIKFMWIIVVMDLCSKSGTLTRVNCVRFVSSISNVPNALITSIDLGKNSVNVYVFEFTRCLIIY